MFITELASSSFYCNSFGYYPTHTQVISLDLFGKSQSLKWGRLLHSPSGHALKQAHISCDWKSFITF